MASNGSKAVETEERAQMNLEERPVEDLALEGQLRSWMTAKKEIANKREDFKNKDEKLGTMVAEREMAAGTYRIGAYIVIISDVVAHQRIKVKEAED